MVLANTNKLLVAMFYFSDTPEQNIHFPIYDMDILLIRNKTKKILNHYHVKEFIQEIGVDITPARSSLKAKINPLIVEKLTPIR